MTNFVRFYSSTPNSGSSGITITGFWSASFSSLSETYFLSTTRRNIYSLNHSLVMIRQPPCPHDEPQLFSTFHFRGLPLSVEVYGSESHGVGRTAVECFDALGLVHREVGTEERDRNRSCQRRSSRAYGRGACPHRMSYIFWPSFSDAMASFAISSIGRLRYFQLCPS